MANGLKLLEGTKNDRDKYIKRTDVLDINKELHKVKQKLKTANKDNKKLSMHISRLTILNEDTDFQKNINSTAFKMERNGNLTKM